MVEQNELLYFSINTDDGTINFVRYNISTELIINTKATFETIFNEKYEKKDNISYICSQNISNSNEYYCFSIFDKNYGKQFKQYVVLDKNTLNIVYHGNDEESLYHDDGLALYDASNITINGKTFSMSDIKFSRYISKDDTEIYEGRDGFVESIVCQYDNTYIITANGFEYKFYVYRLDLETMTAFQVGHTNRSGIPTAIVKRGN